ncbi:hypothetical protein [Methylicorpusculum sp.]|uniref:hypothetical protein n=1 Tax=Methylicorpusculum sp. TaxID=2713644 RepID=UPI002730F5CB|nr:hypothetical protein [Methylicorpusculum sp.]MDP3528461.1 hypothetical protein [Methylicorpusculum sp.]MDZ4149602.1 hypothetical protein [Methylicorpusculum sp.]
MNNRFFEKETLAAIIAAFLFHPVSKKIVGIFVGIVNSYYFLILIFQKLKRSIRVRLQHHSNQVLRNIKKYCTSLIFFGFAYKACAFRILATNFTILSKQSNWTLTIYYTLIRQNYQPNLNVDKNHPRYSQNKKA